ncbi:MULTISPECIES: BTAD domain-containing putative transcriptional regulator [unclassified Streptomyces]|uniref:BTAD domain-containing putative transcriptional regulator n=1 Tax=unclassified Streptomyces TaxID=2593676 RepID=UPI003818ED13
MTVRFGMLGTIEAWWDGVPMDVGHARQRRVLGVLLTDAGRVVSADALVDRVWGEAGPRRGREVLYGYVSRLRRVMAGPGLDIVRAQGGYRLAVEAGSVDVNQFRGLVDRARQLHADEQAVALWEAALGLWRGEAFTGADTPWFNAQRDLLDTERLAAQLDMTDIRLRLGQHRRVVSELSALTEAHPLDERLAGQLALALYRSGRPADALDLCHRTRQRLAEELGMDPGAALRQLHQDILTADARLTLARPAEPRAPQPGTAIYRVERPQSLVGRLEEVSVLRAVLDDQSTQAPRVVEIVGEPGMGKTRLLAEFGELAAHSGAVVLVGRGAEISEIPYGLFIDTLDGALPAVDPGHPRLHGADGRESQGSLDALTANHHGAEASLPAERFRRHRAVRELLEEVHPGFRLVLILDDVHWADESSIELIEYLVRHPPRRAVTLVLGYRPRQAPPRLASALVKADADGHLTRVALGPLSASAAAQLCGPQVSRLRCRQLYEATAGNPFYLQALLRRTGDGEPTDDQLPLSARATLLDELENLSAGARVVARAAAVLDDPFDAEMTAVVAQVDESDMLAALDELTRRDLIRPVSAIRQFEFRHPLVRSAVYDGMGAGWRLGAHARAAAGLERRGASPVVQAPHVVRSARSGDERAVALLTQAADDLMSSAPATSAHWTRETLRLLPAKDARRSELRLKEATALGTAGRLRDSRDILRELASSALVPPHPRRTQAVVSLAVMERLLGRYEAATAVLRRELAQNTGLSAAEATALEIQIAAAELRNGDFSLAVNWGRRALLSARRAGEPVQVAGVRALLALAHISAGETTEGARCLDAAVTALDDTEDRRLLEHLDALMLVGWTEILQRRHKAALGHLDRGLALVRRTGQNYLLTDLLTATAFAHLGLGNLSEAAAYADDAAEAALLLGTSEPRALAMTVEAAVSMWRGDFPAALKICEEAVAARREEPPTRRMVVIGMLGQAQLLCGDPAACVRTVLDGGGGRELPLAEAPERPLWFRTLAQAELAQGNVEAAQMWVRQAACAVTPDQPGAVHGLVLLAHAEVALPQDSADAARAGLEAAAAFSAAEMPLYEASARAIVASALAALGDQSASFDEAARAQ